MSVLFLAAMGFFAAAWLGDKIMDNGTMSVPLGWGAIGFAFLFLLSQPWKAFRALHQPPATPPIGERVAHLERIAVAQEQEIGGLQSLIGLHRHKAPEEGKKKEREIPWGLMAMIIIVIIVFINPFRIDYANIIAPPTAPALLEINQVEIVSPDVRGYQTLKGAVDGNISGSSTWATKVRFKISEYSPDKKFFRACDSAPTPNCFWFRDGPGILRGN